MMSLVVTYFVRSEIELFQFPRILFLTFSILCVHIVVVKQ